MHHATVFTLSLLAIVLLGGCASSGSDLRYAQRATAEREGERLYATGSRIPRRTNTGDEDSDMKSHQNLRTYDREDLELGRPF